MDKKEILWPQDPLTGHGLRSSEIWGQQTWITPKRFASLRNCPGLKRISQGPSSIEKSPFDPMWTGCLSKKKLGITGCQMLKQLMMLLAKAPVSLCWVPSILQVRLALRWVRLSAVGVCGGKALWSVIDFLRLVITIIIIYDVVLHYGTR